MDNLSPGVERAFEAIRQQSATPTVADWLRVLLADDEARPAMLLARLGIDREGLLGNLDTLPLVTTHAHDVLARSARDLSVKLRGDPDFTTDFLMLAILKADLGATALIDVNLFAFEDALRSPLMDAGPAPAAPTPDALFLISDVTDKHDAMRILDVNLNRARESLRILDDFARFVRNDATLTANIKTLRHRLADLMQHLPLPSLLASRDTGGDVGTSISTASESHRESPLQVATVNCKRLQESLRSAEEFGKLIGAHVGRELEAIRYQAYTLEATLLGGSPLREQLSRAKLYLLVSGEGCTANLEWTVMEAAAGGVDIVQLREKSLPDRELLARAKQMRQWTRAAKVLFIMNDRPDIARLCDADGVHLGQDDMNVIDARRVLGPRPLIGVSTHNLKQIQGAIRDGADYLGVGPTFPSTTKSFDTLAGLQFVREATAATSLPTFVLGGVNLVTIDDAVQAGASRVAVSAVIAQTDDPRLVASRLKGTLA
ncbi:hypothetical protein BH11PLA2_BH11PLA2_32040 [soil metagenome]